MIRNRVCCFSETVFTSTGVVYYRAAFALLGLLITALNGEATLA